MDTFDLLCQFKCSLSPNDFDNLRKQSYLVDSSTYFDQIASILSRSNGTSDKVEMFLNYIADPGHAMKVARVFEQFDLLQQAQQLLHPTDFAGFVECFEFGRHGVPSTTIMANLDKWKQLVPQNEALDILLGQLDTKELQQQTSYPTAQQFAPGMESLMQQAYDALEHDPNLCQQFTSILDADQMNGLPFADSIMNIYQWIQTIDPDLWYPLATVLEQMQTLQESATNQYESYEDFVQKNFLDDDGQKYLDGEIEQARVQHLFNNMSM